VLAGRSVRTGVDLRTLGSRLRLTAPARLLWSDLINRLRRIDNPVVPTSPSRYAIPVRRKRRGSGD
jgi:hypothetical protein